MDKETLSNYGWIVICVLVLAVMIALATPFGNFISEAVQSTTKGLFDVNKNALNSANVPGLTVDDQEFNKPYDHNAPELHPIGTIPEGAYYANLNTGTFYTEMPATVSDADVYLYGDYLYVYSTSIPNGWSVLLAREELGLSTYVPDFVFTDSNQSSYGPILESINGQPVISMDALFQGCISLTVAPAIPSSVKDLYKTFYGCTSLTTAPEIPNSVTKMSYTFAGCTALTTAPVIPSNVDSLWYAFDGCTSLTGTITINANPTSYEYCLQNTQITEILGSCGNKTAILATK